MNEGTMRRAMGAVLAGALLAGVMVGTAPSSGARLASVVRARQFTATGIISRDHTRQTVVGIYRNARGRPVDVTVYNWLGQALVTKHRPKLDTVYAGGYWHDTYGFDQWYVGRTADASFHFMLPPAPMGSTFTALFGHRLHGRRQLAELDGRNST